MPKLTPEQLGIRPSNLALEAALARGFSVARLDDPAAPLCIGAHPRNFDRTLCDHNPKNGKRERGKHPVGKWKDEAGLPPQDTRRRFSDGPSYNVGVACGPSGIWVVDEDTPGEFSRLCASLGIEVPRTYRVQTGKGYHFYFRQPVGGPAIRNADLRTQGFNTDIKGDGGYVVGAHSVHYSGAIYEPEDDLAEIVAAPPELVAFLRGTPRGATTPRSNPARQSLAELLADPPARGEGRMNNWLKDVAGHYAKQHHNDRAKYDARLREAAALADPDYEDLGKVADSIWKAERRNHPERDEKPQDDSRAIRMVSLADVEFLVTEWAWDEVIPFGTLSGIAGWAGIGKSSLVASLVAKWTRGELPGEMKGEPTSVVMVAGEDDTARQLAPRLSVAGADLHRVFEVQATRRLDSGVEVNAILNLEEDLPRIRERLIETGARVLVLDPILSFVSGDPNHQRDVRAALDPLAALARELNLAVVLVMHFKKGTGAAGEKVSGSHVWRDALRSLLVMAEDRESGYRIVTLDKSNYGPAGRSMMFEVESVEVTGRNSKNEQRRTRVSLAKYAGESSKSVNDILNEEQTRHDGRHQVDSGTAEILAWIVDQPDGARWVDICKQADIDPNGKEPEDKKARQNLSAKLKRAVNRGDLSKDAKGLYRRPPVLEPLAGLAKEDF